MKARNAFSERIRNGTVNDEPDMAKQSMKDECNINNIVARFQRTGVVDHLNKHGPNYGFADSITLHESMEIVRKAQEMFDDLPSEIRKRFVNDPAAFLDFVQNPENQDEAVRLGLAVKPEAEPSSSDSSLPAPAGSGAAIAAPVSGGSGGAAPSAPAGAPTQ